MAWYIGNTTVRTPYRLVEGLRCIDENGLSGQLEGYENEIRFARVLHITGVLLSGKIAANEIDNNVASIVRKWRSALGQLGFLTDFGQSNALGPEEALFPEIAGQEYAVSPAGRRLLAADSLPDVTGEF